LAREGDGDLTVTAPKGERVTVPARLVKEALGPRSSRDSVNALVAGGRAFVAFHDRFGSAYPLLCFDSKSGKLLWRTEVWASGTENIGVLSGSWSHRTYLVPHKDSLVIFGSAPSSYMEALDAATGKPLYRFCRSAWYAKPE
jgi:outer membrane protein assembly factor BamB